MQCMLPHALCSACCLMPYIDPQRRGGGASTCRTGLHSRGSTSRTLTGWCHDWSLRNGMFPFLQPPNAHSSRHVKVCNASQVRRFSRNASQVWRNASHFSKCLLNSSNASLLFIEVASTCMRACAWRGLDSDRKAAAMSAGNSTAFSNEPTVV